jgi:hypothetical protein
VGAERRAVGEMEGKERKAKWEGVWGDPLAHGARNGGMRTVGTAPRKRAVGPSWRTMARRVGSMLPPAASSRVLATVSGRRRRETPARAPKPTAKEAAAPRRASEAAPAEVGESAAVSLLRRAK